jgi:pyridinium-3,5-bisthiocarboxylic acid mononucleotide nickel chelatase
MKIAYFDCISGISGNMILGALIDAGLDAQALRAELAKLHLTGYALETTPVKKNGIASVLVDVNISETGVHRHLPDIERIIDDSALLDPIRATAKNVFRRLADAEAQVHGTTPDRIHFHEVGGMDAIVDIVGAVVGLSLLGVEQVAASPIPTGRGWITAAHGRLPVPAPATAALLQGVPLSALDVEAELTTPTGAAIITTLATHFGLQPAMIVDHIGYGAGHRDLAHPNVLRVMIGRLAGSEETSLPDAYDVDTVTVIEANIDNMNPEFFDHVMTRLLASGAVDVFLTPVQMKRNRPATTLSVLAPGGSVDAALDIIFAETTTLGVRTYETRRRKLPRQEIAVSLPGGRVRVKVATLHGVVKNVAPEYVDCREIAEETGEPIKSVYDAAKAAALKALSGS